MKREFIDPATEHIIVNDVNSFGEAGQTTQYETHEDYLNNILSQSQGHIHHIPGNYIPLLAWVNNKNKKGVSKMTTAREFLSSQNLEVNETNLFLLTKYTDSDIDYQQFPDADVNVENNNDFRDRLEWVATAPLNEISEWKKNYKGETKMTNWIKLIEEHEDKVMDAFMEANKAAALDYLHPSRHGNVMAVVMDTNGEIQIYCQERNVITGEVKEGTEIYLAFFPVADNWNFEDEDESIEAYLENEFKTFKKWCEGNDLSVSFSALEEYDREKYEEIVRDIISDTVENTCYDIAVDKLEVIKGELAMEEQNKREGLLNTAHERVDNIPELREYEDIIFYDWSNWDEHIEWVATAPIDEIVDWAKNDVGKGDN